MKTILSYGLCAAFAAVAAVSVGWPAAMFVRHVLAAVSAAFVH